MSQNLNNISRQIFKTFISVNNLDKVDNRNVFDSSGRRYAFAVTEGDKIVCRQFYDDCQAVVCLNKTTGILYEIESSKLKIDASPNRITNTGLRAYTASATTTNATVSKYRISL